MSLPVVEQLGRMPSAGPWLAKWSALEVRRGCRLGWWRVVVVCR
jgi:hypothetical protein